MFSELDCSLILRARLCDLVISRAVVIAATKYQGQTYHKFTSKLFASDLIYMDYHGRFRHIGRHFRNKICDYKH